MQADERAPAAAERYALSWPGKAECVRAIDVPSVATLRPLPERSLDFERTRNAIVEGDNLEVLKLLQRGYAGAIKLIYIDPPYNTGNEVIYRDDYAEPLRAYLQYTGQADAQGRAFGTSLETSGRVHSRWLSMIYPRLALARNLLRDDGVICVSCDDREVFNLRIVMNELFGEARFCGVIKRRASRKTAFLRKTMSDACDYVVIYSKGALAAPLSAGEVTDATRPVFNAGNAVTERVIPAGVEARCPDGVYPAGTYRARSLAFTLHGDLAIRAGKTVAGVVVSGPWRINQRVLSTTVYITKSFALRRYLTAQERTRKKLLGDLLDDPRCYNEAGSEELAALFEGRRLFDNPKPVQLVQSLIEAAGVGGDDIVLDFFAGSGTTAHAVLALNARDGGRRAFILVQLPERTGRPDYPTIADITAERVRRACASLPGAPDRGFRAFALADPQLRAAPGSSAGPGGAELDFVFAIALESGLPLSAPLRRDVAGAGAVYDLADGACAICCEPQLSSATIAAIAARRPRSIVLLDAAFAGDDQLKVNAARSLAARGIALRTV